MATVTIKNIPDDVYEKFREIAKSNQRSVNSEIIWLITREVELGSLPVDEVLSEAAVLRELTAHYRIDNETLTAWKQEGRQ